MFETSGGLLTIDLNIIKSNYARLRHELGGKDCAAVVKADAYGLGLEPVSKALWQAGARSFFVALPNEGIELRNYLPEADIHILVGALPGTEEVLQDHNLIPVLNSLEQIKRWDSRGRFDIQIDTGMTRLGLPPRDLQHLPQGLKADILMSHFACADDKDHALNQHQIEAFNHATQHIAHKRASLANSSGIFLSEHAQFDLGRPGCALYGINPTPHKTNPMGNPVRLQGKIAQVHDIDTQQSVGYGATQKLQAGQKLATIALGYADGYLRSLSSQGELYINDVKVPVVGRVSMDVISIDVSGLDVAEGQWVDVIGPHNPPDLLAEKAGTIGYEILTSLGGRYQRVYKG
ncbi:Alanine racemase [Candidatus Terasakiella magnetica]|uniref:Alanine racemase n=1 Tax=Candidatus Terasakiella magnetica TaxID=1867952 RepID=A0A1C3RJV2_9PROT|nr:alanine racemase [Candidatus Terasakiella magnetica]SCA57545.1 Alanine racemase [Candidatus Terasakiella magnetica]